MNSALYFREARCYRLNAIASRPPAALVSSRYCPTPLRKQGMSVLQVKMEMNNHERGVWRAVVTVCA